MERNKKERNLNRKKNEKTRVNRKNKRKVG